MVGRYAGVAAIGNCGQFLWLVGISTRWKSVLVARVSLGSVLVELTRAGK